MVGVKRCAGRGEGSDCGAILNTKHVLVSRHGSRDLEELGEEKHRDPEELKADPNSQKRSVRISVDELAQSRAKDIARV